MELREMIYWLLLSIASQFSGIESAYKTGKFGCFYRRLLFAAIEANADINWMSSALLSICLYAQNARKKPKSWSQLLIIIFPLLLMHAAFSNYTRHALRYLGWLIDQLDWKIMIQPAKVTASAHEIRQWSVFLEIFNKPFVAQSRNSYVYNKGLH